MRLSIVTTMYNSAKYLPKCVDSLLDQDLPEDEYELILVNDGSPDNSLELAEQYASCHKNIKVLSHANKGLAGARNTGLEVAKGEYLCFVDPDDYVHPNIYGKLLGMMEEGHLDMLRFNYDMVNEEYQIINKPKGTVIDYSHQIMDGETFMDERLGYGCFVWSYVYRMSFLRKTRIMFKEGAYFDDTNWLPQVCCKADKIDSVDFVGYYYLQRSGSLVNSMTEDAKQKRIKGQVDLICYLKDFADQTHSDKVRHWCLSMISVTVLAIMSFAVQESNKEVVKMVSGLPVFPLELRLKNTIVRVKCKLRLINRSPEMYYKMFQLLK